MDKLLLRALLSLSKMLNIQGIDFERLKIITETKITMDRRRVRSNLNQQKNKEHKNPLLITLLVYTVLGFVMAAMIMASESLILSMIFFSFLSAFHDGHDTDNGF
jgi:hypothetical protein